MHYLKPLVGPIPQRFKMPYPIIKSWKEEGYYGLPCVNYKHVKGLGVQFILQHGKNKLEQDYETCQKNLSTLIQER